MSASLVTWACPACGEEGQGDMPPEHEAHKAPRARELIAIVPEGHTWAVTTVPIEHLSPMQRAGLYFNRNTEWWCAPLP